MRGTEELMPVGNRSRASRADVALFAACGAWFLLAVVASLREVSTAPDGPQVWAAYLAFAPMLLLGVAVGRSTAWRRLGPLVPVVLLLLALTVFLGHPDYLNAQAAAGVQLVAVAALLCTRSAGRSGPVRWRPALLTLAALLGVLGIALGVRAKAGGVLMLVVLVLGAAALTGRLRVSRAALLGGGLGAVVLAILGVLLLGSAAEWPERLTYAESLSSARHELWSDALALWREHPLVGGGPGSFYASSELAASDPLLYAAHSSILQVGAELGAIGVLVFSAVLVAGAAQAAQGEGSRALIGVTAWCALAVHSMIDHLYEFPVVVLLAGAVIGWAGSPSGLGGGLRRGGRHPRHDGA
ncbi:O-antigen ligase family protein [Brachybacterium tyrofermentans]|uniref:O-antigen ligase family protein n=1 Tax=Brachybacterium tyrofermentans TaxID=47848 RepID=UPI003F917F6B